MCLTAGPPQAEDWEHEEVKEDDDLSQGEADRCDVMVVALSTQHPGFPGVRLVPFQASLATSRFSPACMRAPHHSPPARLCESFNDDPTGLLS